MKEEVLPLNDHLGQNSAATMDEDPVTDSVVANDSAITTMDEDQAQDDHIHPAPDSYSITNDHMVLIFEMRRDLVEQQHHRSFFGKHLDALYASLSSELEKSH